MELRWWGGGGREGQEGRSFEDIFESEFSSEGYDDSDEEEEKGDGRKGREGWKRKE